MTSQHAPIHHDPQRATVLWDITPRCNYRCSYCYSELLQNREGDATHALPLEQLARAFSDTLPGWIINFSGGEPFVYPRLPELAARLADDHLLGFYSNLSVRRQVERFAALVPPERVMFINCGFHIKDRIKRDPEFTQFFAAHDLLVSRGFPLATSYILHPDNEDRAANDVAVLRSRGVRVHVQVFRGIFNGRSYPESFSGAAVALCESSECKPWRGEAVRSQMSGLGSLCRAGSMFLELSANGDAYRCGTDRSLGRDCLGNLFEGTLVVCATPKICRSDVCVSCRQGLSLSVDGLRPLGRRPAAIGV